MLKLDTTYRGFCFVFVLKLKYQSLQNVKAGHYVHRFLFCFCFEVNIIWKMKKQKC